VAVLRHFGELVIDEDTAALLVSMSAATIDRRLAGERAKYQLKGRASTKPGSLLKSQIPVRTWADWDDARPGFVEVDLVGHDGGNPAGQFAFTLTVTDIATGWTENRSVPDKTAKCVLAALNDIAYKMPFPILGVDSDNGSEFINVHLAAMVQRHQITFTRARRQQERRLSRRAEELGGGPHRGRLPPLRHRRRTVVTQRDLAAAVQADQLLLPAAETDIQGPRRRQGGPRNTTPPPPRSIARSITQP
jgi:Integrase core domain.